MKYVFRLCIVTLIISSCNNITDKSKKVALNGERLEVANTKEIIKFPSKDGLSITADIYSVDNKPVSILLCHQAGYSRGEYMDTAVKLNNLGFSVMAIDQRSGNSANGVLNETNKAAKSKEVPTGFLDARQDIEVAIDYLYAKNNNEALLLVGSSYSASLSLLIANENDKVKSVAAFSPGEYFDGINIQERIKDISKPVFVTASNKETAALETLVNHIDPQYLTHYKPKEKGIHGSRALWESTSGSEGYWSAFEIFINN